MVPPAWVQIGTVELVPREAEGNRKGGEFMAKTKANTKAEAETVRAYRAGFLLLQTRTDQSRTVGSPPPA
jgi:hypothetical protein